MESSEKEYISEFDKSISDRRAYIFGKDPYSTNKFEIAIIYDKIIM